MQKPSFFVKLISATIVFSIVICAACRKPNNNSTEQKTIPVNSLLKADFTFQPGSYWIYKDSVSGEVDSAYVATCVTSKFQMGCLGPDNAPLYEITNIAINFKTLSMGQNNTMADGEAWHLILQENVAKMYFIAPQDSTESLVDYTLFRCPFATGFYRVIPGCVFRGPQDSSYVADILPVLTVDNVDYANTAISRHINFQANLEIPVTYFDDYFYVNPAAGIVKVIFNHPGKPIRIL